MKAPKTIENISITRYRNAQDAFGDFEKAVPFDSLYRATLTDTEDKRAARHAETDAALKAAKMRVPMWYPCGYCFGEHNAENVTPCGIVAIDLDDISAERQPEIKARLARIPCIFFAAQSISGKGLYALASVSLTVQTDPQAVLRLLELIDAAVLAQDRHEGEHIDTACKDVARRRFESYDASPYYQPEKFAHEYTGTRRSNCERAYQGSCLAALAHHFGGRPDDRAGSAQTGFALAALAVASGGRVAGRVFTENFYAARSQVVILGQSGDGKSTQATALRRVCNAIGARPVSAESDRALEAALVESGLQKGLDDNGAPDWAQICPPIPLLSITEEAGDEQASRRNRDYKSKLNSIKRRTYDTLFHASASLSTKLPQKDFVCSYTDVQISTPKRWADALRGTDASAGDRRRVLEFWTATPERPAGALNVLLADFAAQTANPPKPANLEALEAVLGALKQDLPDADADCISLRLDGLRSISDFEWLEYLQELQTITTAPEAFQDVKTMICAIATLIAWSDGEPEITPRAIDAAWAVVYGVYENRAKLQDTAEVSAITAEASIAGEILDYIGDRTIRLSAVRRMLAKRGMMYTKTLDGLISNGALTVTKGKSATIRQSTEAEAEAKAAELSSAPAARPEAPSVWNGQTNGAPKSYAECDREEKLQRLAKYREEFERDKPIVPGMCDNHLRALRYQLEKCGMWDDVAEQWLRDVCEEVGHVKEKDKDRICREIRGGVA